MVMRCVWFLFLPVRLPPLGWAAVGDGAGIGAGAGAGARTGRAFLLREDVLGALADAVGAAVGALADAASLVG